MLFFQAQIGMQKNKGKTLAQLKSEKHENKNIEKKVMWRKKMKKKKKIKKDKKRHKKKKMKKKQKKEVKTKKKIKDKNIERTQETNPLPFSRFHMSNFKWV